MVTDEYLQTCASYYAMGVAYHTAHYIAYHLMPTRYHIAYFVAHDIPWKRVPSPAPKHPITPCVVSWTKYISLKVL